MLSARTISVSVRRNWRELYDRFRRPETFPEWASGLSDASLTRNGDIWTAIGPEGPVSIRFSERNDLGVMDHWVDLGGGQVVYVPLRIIENDDGALVMLTLYRQPGMSDGKFAEDAAWVERDLMALKALAES